MESENIQASPQAPVAAWLAQQPRTQAGLDVWRERYYDLYDQAPVGYLTVSATGLILEANLTVATLLGIARSELAECQLDALIFEEDQGIYDRQRTQLLTSGVPQSCEVRLVRHDGTPITVQLQIVAAQDGAGTPVLRVVVSDISQQQQATQEIRRLAFYDSLTGLPNRRLLLDRIQQAMLNSARSAQHAALLYMDLDSFKLINDSLGHAVGDLLLLQVTRRLQARVRQGDTVSRFGGDEFVVLLEGLSSRANEAAAQVQTHAHKILKFLGRPYSVREHTCKCTASTGIVVFRGAEQSLEDLLQKADTAMYQAKDSGRNTLRFFDAAMQAEVLAHSARIADLKRGLAQKEFVLYYQIQVNQQGTPNGVEALVRWQHATRGLVPPSDFIALAEETKLILPLGQWVLETACAQLRAWAGQPATSQWTMSVNVSTLQFAQADFLASVSAALQKSGAKPDRLKLELTESMLVNDVEDVISKMKALHALGVRFELDDFGTGYSSLSYIKRLPLERLKIDQSFVRDLLIDDNDVVIIRAIIAMSHSLGFKVIAEGVETASQRKLLTKMDCDAFQGYFFGQPVPAGELAAYINIDTH